MKKRTKKNQSLASLRRKLYSALAMLLISGIMMVTSSYAWLVLSTAPEVSGIATQVGANGSLEIALLDTNSYNDVTLVSDMDIDESAEITTAASNLSWGNLVDLSGSTYGLSQIVLNPSRLSIAKNGIINGEVQYVINPSILKTPVYSEDGRITGLEETAVSVVYDAEESSFSYVSGMQDYGVRAIGTVSSMNALQLGINAARSALVTNMSSARTNASNTLNQYGNTLGNIAIQHAINSGAEEYTTSDVQALLGMAEGMRVALDYIDDAIRQVFVGYICTEESGYSDQFQTLKEGFESKDTLLTSLESFCPDLYAQIEDYIDKLLNDQEKVDNAIQDYVDLLSSGKTTFTWSEISTAMASLVEYDKMTLNGTSVGEVAGMGTSEIISLVSSGGLNISVPTGSGLISDIADFAGNYTAKVDVDGFTYNGIPVPDMTANLATATTYNPVHLTDCSNILRGFTAGSGSDAGNVITDYFGYVLDLAFRTNVADSNLLLQTESTQRIYEDSKSAATQGGGSYMEFTSAAGLSATKMVKLMGGIRVVFVDEEQNVLAIAALDTTLGKDVYTELTEDEKISTGCFAALTGGTVVQNSDYITSAEYNSLPDVSAVEFDSSTGKVKAPLYLYDFSMTVSTASTSAAAEEESDEEGTEEVKYTGGITLGSKASSNAIVNLPESRAQQVSAIVYLDGSYVNNSMVAADSSQSMSGILNLQFASDATLMPAVNQELFDGEEEESAAGDEETPAGDSESGSDEGGNENNEENPAT